VTVEWPGDLDTYSFFQWASRLVRLRRRYPALKLSGYNPAEDGRFTWILGLWLDGRHGGGQKIVGWRAQPNQFAHDTMVVLINFETGARTVDVEFDLPGIWVKLADIDQVEDIPPDGENGTDRPTAIHTGSGRFLEFVLPSSSGFIYKWEAPA
jgi:hypothetical protein